MCDAVRLVWLRQWIESARLVFLAPLLGRPSPASSSSAITTGIIARKSQRLPARSLLVALCAGSKQNAANHDHRITAASLHHFFVVLLLYIYMNTWTARRNLYTYVCQFFALLPTFLFVKALFGKTPSTRIREARPDTLAEVSARSAHSGARGGRSKFFPRREWIRRFPWFRCERPYFVRTYRQHVVCFLPYGCCRLS